MKTNIINAAVIFGILAGINLGFAVALEFRPISFITSIIMIVFGLFSMSHAIELRQEGKEEQG